MSALEEAASGAAITLARCWRVERRDGAVLGFTDHDEPISFGGTLYAAATGMDAAVAEARLGLSVEDTEIAGALASAALTEDDITAGRYDGATVVLSIVDWTDRALHRRMGTYVIGEIVRADGAFRAELRGIVERLERSDARRFSRHCDAELGDARCGVSLETGLRIKASVHSLDDGVPAILDPGGADGFFEHGRAEWTSGANAGACSRIVRTERAGKLLRLHFWRDPALPVEAADTLSLVAGCDKTLATCANRFANAANYRGFPHLPGADAAYRYAAAEDRHDGGPLVE